MPAVLAMKMQRGCVFHYPERALFYAKCLAHYYLQQPHPSDLVHPEKLRRAAGHDGPKQGRNRKYQCHTTRNT